MAGIGDFMGLIGKVKDMQANMQQVQEQLRQQTVEASSGGGMVTATVNGAGEVVGVKINPEAVDVNDLEMLEDLIVSAINAAGAKAKEQMKEEMMKMAGGLNIPGMDQISKLLG